MMQKILPFLVFGFFSTACTHLAEPLVMPEKPAAQQQQALIDITLQGTNSANNDIIQLPHHPIQQSQSIIVSAPLIKKKYRVNDVIKTGVSFQNDPAYKIAEQQIEKDLLMKGLNIISREKLEAELRKYENASIGNKVGPGLLDVSAMIRAAQLKGVKGDYLLKLNTFKIENKGYQIDLAAYPAFQSLLNKFPEATSELLARQFIECSENSVTIEGKIIHIASGNVVWISSLSQGSRDLEDSSLQVKILVNKVATNESEIRDYVIQQNTEEARKLRYQQQSQYPSWRFVSQVSQPVITKGNCNQGNSRSDDLSEQQKELIKVVISHFLDQIQITK